MNDSSGMGLDELDALRLRVLHLEQQVQFWQEEFFKMESRLQSLLKTNEPVTGEPHSAPGD